MSEYFFESLSNELNKEASRSVLRGVVGRAHTKLAEDMNLKKLESQAKSMESKPNLTLGKPKTVTTKPSPALGPAGGKAQTMPSVGSKSVELKKMSSAAGVFLNKIAAGMPTPPMATPGAQTMEQQKPAEQKIPVPNPPKPMPMPSTGTSLTPMGAKTAEDAKGAGAVIKAMLGSSGAQAGEYTDDEQTGVDDPRFGGGKGIENFKGKKAPTFTDRFNPTDVPQAFGKKAAEMMEYSSPTSRPAVSKAIPKSTNATQYGTGCGSKIGCIGGKHGAGCGLQKEAAFTSGFGIGSQKGGRGFSAPSASKMAPKQEMSFGSSAPRLRRKKPGAVAKKPASMGNGLMAPSWDTPKSNVTVGKARALGRGSMRASSRKALGA